MCVAAGLALSACSHIFLCTLVFVDFGKCSNLSVANRGHRLLREVVQTLKVRLEGALSTYGAVGVHFWARWPLGSLPKVSL